MNLYAYERWFTDHVEKLIHNYLMVKLTLHLDSLLIAGVMRIWEWGHGPWKTGKAYSPQHCCKVSVCKAVLQNRLPVHLLHKTNNNQRRLTCRRPQQRNWAQQISPPRSWCPWWPSGLDLWCQHQRAERCSCSLQSLCRRTKTHGSQRQRGQQLKVGRVEAAEDSNEILTNIQEQVHPPLGVTPAKAKNNFTPSWACVTVPVQRWVEEEERDERAEGSCLGKTWGVGVMVGGVTLVWVGSSGDILVPGSCDCPSETRGRKQSFSDRTSGSISLLFIYSLFIIEERLLHTITFTHSVAVHWSFHHHWWVVSLHFCLLVFDLLINHPWDKIQ